MFNLYYLVIGGKIRGVAYLITVFIILAELCPASFSRGSLSDSCLKHDLEMCDFTCPSGFSSEVTQIKCEKQNWNNADPCKPGTYVNESLIKKQNQINVILKSFGCHNVVTVLAQVTEN